MSEQNYAGLAFRVGLSRNPDLFGHIGPDGEFSGEFKKQLDESLKARQVLDAKNAVLKAEPAQVEYNQLRQKLFDLKQNTKCFEVRTNEAAGKIRNIEQRINDVLKLKKGAAEMGNLRGERNYEQSIQRLETELGDAEQEFEKNKRWNGQVARALKEFDGHARIETLKLLLDQSLPDVKSVSVPK